MKRLDLVQLTLIIIGICSAFFCLELTPRFLYYLFAWFSSGLAGGYMMEGFIGIILLLTVYLLFALFCIRNSKQLAQWISNKANLHTDINFRLNKEELLYAVFIGLGIYGLIRDLPILIRDAYAYIKGSNENNIDTGMLGLTPPDQGTLVIQVIKVLLLVILVIYANVFAHFLAGRINNTEPEDEITSKIDP